MKPQSESLQHSVEGRYALDAIKADKATRKRLEKRLEYWRNHSLTSGWSLGGSGPCCDKCSRTKKGTEAKDPLQALVGCRDPFQIECQCHIPFRRAFREYMVMELEAALGEKS